MVITALDAKIKPGYKQTEVGAIPEDWEVCSLGEIVTKVGSGITPTGGEKVYKKEGRPFLRSQNVGWGYLLLDDIAFIDEETHKSFLATEIKLDDVLLNITGALIGRSAVADERLLRGNVNQHVCIIRTDASKLSPSFLNFFLLSKNGQKQIDSFQAGGNRQGLNFEQIKSFQIPLPPLPEQHAIATALKDVDALIKSLDKHIIKKRDIKQAMMQQLLTGTIRLPGFSGERGATLGDFFELNPNKMSLRNTDLVTFIRMEDVSESGRIINRNIMPLSSIQRGLTYFERNDVLVAKITPCFENGKGACLDTLETKCGFGSTEFHVLRAKKNAVPRYIFYQTQLSEFRTRLEAEMIGTAGQKRVPVRTIIDYPLPIYHSKDEQLAIATILSDMDSEISALEQKRDKTRALKQGMMQELLTGKTRLI
jgi:type I restriction enzyme, S subunit